MCVCGGVLENKRDRNRTISCRNLPPNSNPAFVFAELAVPTGAWAPVMAIFPSCTPQTPPQSALAEGSARRTWSPVMVIPLMPLRSLTSPLPSPTSLTPHFLFQVGVHVHLVSLAFNESLYEHLPMKPGSLWLSVGAYHSPLKTVPWGQSLCLTSGHPDKL